MSRSKFFIFATEGTPYIAMAYNTCESFREFGVAVDVIKIAKRDTWMQNCLRRSVELSALADRWEGYGIGMFDADLECLKEPLKLKSFSGDVAVRDLGLDDEQWVNNKSCRYSAGVILFGASAYGRECLHGWAKRCVKDEQKNEHLREQVYLYEAIEEVKKKGAIIQNIGATYNQPVSSDTVILHHVVSRKLREQMGGGM